MDTNAKDTQIPELQALQPVSHRVASRTDVKRRVRPAYEQIRRMCEAASSQAHDTQAAPIGSPCRPAIPTQRTLTIPSCTMPVSGDKQWRCCWHKACCGCSVPGHADHALGDFEPALCAASATMTGASLAARSPRVWVCQRWCICAPLVVDWRGKACAFSSWP